MTPIIIGEKNAHVCLIQPVDEHDASFLEKEYALIRDFTDQTPFVLAAFTSRMPKSVPQKHLRGA